MPQRDTYMLQIWRGRALGGRQWVARLEQLPGGEQLRFADPRALLEHLRELVTDDAVEHESDGRSTETRPSSAGNAEE